MNYSIPAGYIHPFSVNDIPRGWTAMDGQNETPDLRFLPTETQSGHGPALVHIGAVWCMFDWPKFHKENPEWVGPNAELTGASGDFAAKRPR